MEDENSMFLMEEALEMILVFNEEGVVSYANAAARKKLGYEESHTKEVPLWIDILKLTGR